MNVTDEGVVYSHFNYHMCPKTFVIPAQYRNTAPRSTWRFQISCKRERSEYVTCAWARLISSGSEWTWETLTCTDIDEPRAASSLSLVAWLSSCAHLSASWWLPPKAFVITWELIRRSLHGVSATTDSLGSSPKNRHSSPTHAPRLRTHPTCTRRTSTPWKRAFGCVHECLSRDTHRFQRTSAFYSHAHTGHSIHEDKHVLGTNNSRIELWTLTSDPLYWGNWFAAPATIEIPHSCLSNGQEHCALWTGCTPSSNQHHAHYCAAVLLPWSCQWQLQVRGHRRGSILGLWQARRNRGCLPTI